GPAFVNISWSMAAVACAAAGWVWSQRKFNVVISSVTAAILCGCFVITLYGVFGRRPLVGVVFGFAWGAYYRWARHVAPAKLMLYLIPVFMAGSLVIVAFTAVRGQTSKENASDVGAVLGAMGSANLKEGGNKIAGGQAVPGAMLWALEQYPDKIEPKPLFSLRYMAMYFIPRQIWEDKPKPLSTEVATLAKLKGVNRERITLPPGVIGYAAAEGGFYAVIIYALFFGQFTRFFDELIKHNLTNPFIILPAGCVTGQFLGLARGDIAVFADIIMVSFTATIALMYLAKFFFGRRSVQDYATQWAPQA
ncbi:hypothetical protein OAS39_13210, partial [Pirellulales bacterium]|nr:hypothetical protein [Pirellulales bacterium]